MYEVGVLYVDEHGNYFYMDEHGTIIYTDEYGTPLVAPVEAVIETGEDFTLIQEDFSDFGEAIPEEQFAPIKEESFSFDEEVFGEQPQPVTQVEEFAHMGSPLVNGEDFLVLAEREVPEELMKNPVVSNSGQTLEELMGAKDLWNKSINKNDEAIEDFLATDEQALKNKERNQDRYRKAVKKEEEKIASQKTKSSFLAKHQTITSAEKRLHRNIGISSKNFEVLRNTQSISLEQKRRIAMKGMDTTEFKVKGRLYKVNNKDWDILIFLAKFKGANLSILRRIHGVSFSQIEKRMFRLGQMGVVKMIPQIGGADMWALTSTGMLISGFDFPVITKFSPLALSQIVPVNYVASFLYGGKFDILNTKSVLPNTRLGYQSVGIPMHEVQDYLEGQELISELQIRRSMFSHSVFKQTNSHRELGNFANGVLAQADGVSNIGVEFEPDNEYLFVLYKQDNLDNVFHIPDIVIPRLREKGVAKSIAVEIEMNPKSISEYERILRVYKEDNRVFEKVVWIVKKKGIMTLILTAMENIGMTDGCEVLPLLGENGKVYKGNILHL